MRRSTAYKEALAFLTVSGEFRLGELVTESSHPRTRELSRVAQVSIPNALGLLFGVDEDVARAYREWVATDAPERIARTVSDALRAGRKLFFTGCGATGRLSILLETVWRDYWSTDNPLRSQVHSVMAGGDYALIKSVEGFEDFAQFGMKQIEDMGVTEGDVVFAVTEGGETSFVIGAAWKGLEKGANVYFVYCNPDHILRERVTRSREILDEPRVEKVNLTTGPMAVTGSTRMQAASIQLLAMLTVLETAAAELSGLESSTADVDRLCEALNSEELRAQLAHIVDLEAETYRNGKKSAYFADHLGLDVLTDTTERSPTFCTPAFRKWDDGGASDSWTYLILPQPDSQTAWERLLRRPPRGLAWTESEILDLIGPERAPRQAEIMSRIGTEEILRFRIGANGLRHRPLKPGDLAVCVACDRDAQFLLSPDGFFRTQLEAAHRAGASTAVIYVGAEGAGEVRDFLAGWEVPCRQVIMSLPKTGLLLDGITRMAAKMLLNALSTCVMVRLGRVLGNCMVAVVPSNLKLIDRSVRYVQNLTGLSYEDACHLLFESIERVRPRMRSGRAYPPPVELSVCRYRDNCSLKDAELLILKSNRSRV